MVRGAPSPFDAEIAALGDEARARPSRKLGEGFVALSRKRMPRPRAEAVERVLAEREHQIAIGFDPAHDASHVPVEWATLIQKYAGRLADNALEKRYESYRKNLVVIAAVCLGALEVDVDLAPVAHRTHV